MKDKIRGFIQTTFLEEGCSVTDEESLFDSGVLDSMGLFQLLAFIEQELQVTVEMSEVSVDNFDSINQIIEFIQKKR